LGSNVFHRWGTERSRMHAFKLLWSFLRISIANQMQYRANFFTQLLSSFISLGTGLIGLLLVFSYTNSLNGWTQPQLLAVLGIYILMNGIIHTAIQPNMERFMDEVHQGTLDFILTKPVDSQVLVSIREFDFWQLVDVLTGLIVLSISFVQMHEQVSVLVIAAFLLALFLGSLMIYCFWMIVTTSAFWLIRIYNIVELFQGLYAAGRWPVSIYPDWLRIGLTFLVPVAFAVTIPAEALTARLTPLTLLGEAGLTAVFMVLSRFFWRLGVRHYSGASA
jgi:ABC-2 type transport system permease protein